MLEGLFTFVDSAIKGAPILALAVSLLWGILSILLSPCHLSSIPLIVGYMTGRGEIPGRRAFAISSMFAFGILITMGVIGGLKWRSGFFFSPASGFGATSSLLFFSSQSDSIFWAFSLSHFSPGDTSRKPGNADLFPLFSSGLFSVLRSNLLIRVHDARTGRGLGAGSDEHGLCGRPYFALRGRALLGHRFRRHILQVGRALHEVEREIQGCYNRKKGVRRASYTRSSLRGKRCASDVYQFLRECDSARIRHSDNRCLSIANWKGTFEAVKLAAIEVNHYNTFIYGNRLCNGTIIQC